MEQRQWRTLLNNVYQHFSASFTPIIRADIGTQQRISWLLKIIRIGIEHVFFFLCNCLQQQIAIYLFPILQIVNLFLETAHESSTTTQIVSVV